MNLYPKWRLPDGCDEEALYENLCDMQAETRQILESGMPRYTRHDSRTESSRMSTFSPNGSRVSSGLGNNFGMYGISAPGENGGAYLASESAGRPGNSRFRLDDEDDSDWVSVRNLQYTAYESTNESRIGTAI